jgi:hypothetical protein
MKAKIVIASVSQPHGDEVGHEIARGPSIVTDAALEVAIKTDLNT